MKGNISKQKEALFTLLKSPSIELLIYNDFIDNNLIENIFIENWLPFEYKKNILKVFLQQNTIVEKNKLKHLSNINLKLNLISLKVIFKAPPHKIVIIFCPHSNADFKHVDVSGVSGPKPIVENDRIERTI